jgi:hypothetical protein
MSRTLPLTFILFFAGQTLWSQTFSLTDLIDFANYSPSKFNTRITKFGFKPQEEETDFVKYSFQKISKDKKIEKSITKFNKDHIGSIAFEKMTDSEYLLLKAKIDGEGYTSGITKGDAELFQKGNITISAHPVIDSALNEKYFNVKVETRVLPRLKDIHYAEDLLILDSHENIAALFGKYNVVKDVFVHSDGRTKKCSVLFPNSTNEVVFIWEDEVNYKSVAVIRIGGSPHTKGSEKYNSAIGQSSWTSNQGIYVGMSLKELEQKNEAELEFYGWDWNTGGTVVSSKNGKIDLKKISFILSCFNCDGPKYKSNKVNSSTTALEEDKRIHLSTMVLLPPKD